MRLVAYPAITCVFAYLCFWPVPIDPKSWQSPKNNGYVEDFASNVELQGLEFFDIADTHGPEGLAMGPNGNVYASSGEGWILIHNPHTGQTERWVNTGGRPLGITFDKSANLLVADAYLGLLRIAPSGEITLLTDKVGGSKIEYADDVDVAPNGLIYFSDASSKFGAKEYGGTYQASLLDIMEHGGHGRVLVYDPESGSTKILVEGLNFANGIALDRSGNFLLVAETGSYRIIKVWLEEARNGQSDVIIYNLPGFPDNIVGSVDGRFWVGLVAPRDDLLDSLSQFPLLRKVAQRLPSFMRPRMKKFGHVFAINGNGGIITSLQDPQASYYAVTGALEVDRWLYISSLFENKLARLNLSGIAVER